VIVLSSAIVTTRSHAQSGGPYAIAKGTIGAGAGAASVGGTYVISGTIGQPSADVVSGGPYSVQGGFWQLGGAPVTEVQNDPGPTTPRGFMVFDNVPNPFGLSTLIAFDLPRESRTSVAIHALDGRLVRTLMNEARPPGHYQVTWDATDNSRRRVPPGVYLLRIEAGELRATRKLIRVE